MSGLDLTSYVKNPDDPQPVYDLFAVCNHFGGMSGGKCECNVVAGDGERHGRGAC